MVDRPGWVVARWVRRAAWWVFVVIALAGGRISWLDFGDGRSVTYRGAFTPLTDARRSGAFTTTLDLTYDVNGDGTWVTVVLISAAVVLVIAAAVQAVLVRRGALVGAATVVAAPVAVLMVTCAVGGIGGIDFRLWIVVALVLAAVALHEAATVVARPRHP